METPGQRSARKPGARAPLACAACRKRKTKCSGDWPSCRACTQRSQVCHYAGNNPQAVMQRQLHSRPGTPRSCSEDDLLHQLPSKEIVFEAFKLYFEYYGDSTFCFFKEFVLMNDLEHGKVPLRLQFCVLALMARFIEPCFSIYNGTVEASEHFASLARTSMISTFDEISLLNMQCNLILCIHWTGHGDEHRAWFQLGVATRIAQSLRLLFEDSFPEDDMASTEIKRRTFWTCFTLDRLMANGGDRRLTFDISSITTKLPGTRSDFLLGRKTSAGSINDKVGTDEPLLAYTVRIVDILGNIVDWSGAGGRHNENRNPWDPSMPISSFERDLDAWERALPSHMRFNEENKEAHVAVGEGKSFCTMHMFFYNARGHLYREYIPVVIPPGWDPGTGPCDGPDLALDTSNPGWWAHAIRNGVSSAVAISTIYKSMASADLIPLVNPFLGYCLMTSSTFHIWCSLYNWKSCEGVLRGEPVKKLLIDDLRYLIQCQESWPVAAYWVKALRIDFEQNSLVSRNKIPPRPAANKALVEIRSKLLHFGQSVAEPEAWKGYLPTHGHDLFDLFGKKTTAQDSETQETSTLEQFPTSDDVLLSELLGMGYTYSDTLETYVAA